VKKLAKKDFDQPPAKEQLVSTILGMAVVLIIGVLAYRYFQKGKPEQVTPESGSQPTEEVKPEKIGEEISPITSNLPVIYKVQTGDNLWTIAEKFYRSGYNWVDIAAENKLANPDYLQEGQELKIPAVAAKLATVTVKEMPKTGIDALGPGKYTVVEGDSLSSLALRAYGDMFAWDKIYQANKDIVGSNPALIYPGQVLIIPE